MVSYPVSTSTVPANLECVISDANWRELSGLQTVELPDGSKINVGNTEPAPADRGYPWFRFNADGTPDDLYGYANGQWLAEYKNGFVGMVVMWEGDPANIPTIDGGEAGAVSATTGPFWERVTEMDARFPIGPGTLPSTTVLAVGDQGGEEKHALTAAENGPHTHEILGSGYASGATKSNRRVLIDDEHNAIDHEEDTRSSGDGTPHNNMPPYTVICFIRRTARKYKRAS